MCTDLEYARTRLNSSKHEFDNAMKEEEVKNNLQFLDESAAVPSILFREAKDAGLLPEHIPVPAES